MSNTTEETKDCLACRLISGFGILGISGYIYSQSKNRSKLQTNIYKLLAAGAFGLGVARLLNMEFLKAHKKES